MAKQEKFNDGVSVDISDDKVILRILPSIKLTVSPERAKEIGEDLMRAGIKMRADKRLKEWIQKNRNER